MIKFTYKQPETLRRYISHQGMILPRAKSGLRQTEQRSLARAIKRARHLALLPFTQTV
jgi:small subunit ribosomal protein S18